MPEPGDFLPIHAAAVELGLARDYLVAKGFQSG
jgi:hypothetical protein